MRTLHIRPSARSILSLLVIAALTVAASAQERDRDKIPDKYKWNLADIYPDVAAWRAAKEKIAGELPKIRTYEGKLASSPQALADALEHMSRLDKEVSRLYVYASMLADQDTRVSEPQGMQQEMQQLAAAFGAQAAYIEPEILKIGAATIDDVLAAEPRLKVYTFYLRDIARRAPHTLTDTEEKILADAAPLAQSASNIYGILANADFPYPSITLSDGKTVKVDQAGFGALRTSANRADRQQVMSAFFSALGSFGRTYGTTMNSSVQKAIFYSKARKYPTTLEMSLDAANIPSRVYTRLVDGVNKNLPSFHRYLQLRKRMMGIDELHYYDLYAPLFASVDLKYSPEEAQKHVLASLAPLGPDYASVVQRAFNERWIDLFPNEGKRSGAYSNGGAYDVHPYMLINYLGQYNDMSTLSHELGHTMQSYYSNKTQPYPLAGYPIFVAEVASTFNEALLIEHMLAQIKDDATRLSLLGNYLENIKATVFRQTQFAEFELRMHEMAQKGQPLTGDALAKLYLDITKKYYGHDQGVSIVDDYIAHEWSYIPHFYREFYVFQYATSFTASLALAEKVMAGDEAAKKRYLTFLGSGGSKYPIELLKEAGVDMTTDEPLDLTIKKMNRVMDEMEKLLAKVGTTARQRN
jgi:oligoendopeptidase F